MINEPLMMSQAESSRETAREVVEKQSFSMEDRERELSEVERRAKNRQKLAGQDGLLIQASSACQCPCAVMVILA
jgi:hypothetical protein